MKSIKFLVLFLLITILILSFSACVSKGTYEQAQKENTELQVKLHDLENNMGSMQSQMSSLQQQLSSTQTLLEETQVKLNTYEKKITEADNKIQLYKDTFGDVYSEIEPPYKKSPSVKMNSINNVSATDPTWQQLLLFILKDNTDLKPYIPDVFMCGGFSEMVHNNAESAGIRCAIVTIDFQGETIGHALNAFKTTDKGLIYVDCTGKGLQQIFSHSNTDTSENWDKIAYVSIGKEYGSLLLSNDVSSDYSFYLDQMSRWNIYDQKLDDYNHDVEQFNKEISGKVYYIGTSSWKKIKERENSLDTRSKELDDLKADLIDRWEPLGIVSNIEIYW